MGWVDGERNGGTWGGRTARVPKEAHARQAGMLASVSWQQRLAVDAMAFNAGEGAIASKRRAGARLGV